jgi:predicted enzyme related to lactoylglutathione lyase
MTDTPAVGSIAWTDLTVENAPAVCDFYQDVAGWTPAPVAMGEYDDFVMRDANGDGVSGVCHARGENAGLPAQWLIYIVVADLDQSIAACHKHGGKVISEPRKHGTSRFAVIQDPAGAVAGLYEVGSSPESSND